MVQSTANLLDMNHISKSFHDVKVLEDVQFHLQAGTVHAIMGENGAGKSTLMKILVGVYSLDAGEILIEGKPARFSTPREAIANGISMIHQELNIVPEMTIAENIFLGNEPRRLKGTCVDKAEMNRNAKEYLDIVGLKIPTTTKMKELSVAQAQMVEIAKAISKDAKILVMDEPTSSITDTEVETLFGVIRKLKGQGVGIIYITHKMDEIPVITDFVTVMRDGRYIGTRVSAETTDLELVHMMINRELKEVYLDREYTAKETYFEVRHLTNKGKRISDVSFKVGRGEILGFAGLVGAGRTETVESIFGLSKPDSGEIYLKGERIEIRSPKQAISYGIGFVTEDRRGTGIIPVMSCAHNVSIVDIHHLARWNWLIDHKREKKVVDRAVQDFDIRTSNGLKQPLQELSGGNQQKVILAKWVLANLDFLILDEPTRGIDVGAKVEIYHLITQMANAGKTIIVISSEMQEILNLCDRIIVFHEGRISGELVKSEATQEKIMAMAVNI